MSKERELTCYTKKMASKTILSTVNPFYFCFLLFSLSSFITTTTTTTTSSSSTKARYTETQGGRESESDRVINLLPGQPSTPSISHFSGYITVNEDHGRALFYWFFEAQSDPSKKPLLLWLNGGPGCSSIGYGAAVELGPLRVKKNGDGLEFNTYAWNKEANLLFVESPVGVGFSYTNTSSDLTKLDDGFVAEDAYNFLVNWLKRFPQFATHDLFISGESYAGHYVPQLAELIFERNNNNHSSNTKFSFINFKGFIIGNPETEDYYDTTGIVEYAWSHAVISDQMYRNVKQVCDFRLHDLTDECNKAMDLVYQKYQEIDIYNIYAPTCLINKTSAASSTSMDTTINNNDEHNIDPSRSNKERNYGLRKRRIFGGHDPCFATYAEEYFNKLEVQSALHTKITSGKWQVCNDSILRTYNFTVFSVLPIYTKLIKAGYKIWVYSGDADGRVPVIGTRYWTEALGLPLKSPWHSWYNNKQVGGRITEYEGLTFVTVKGAGHLVPLNKPSEALALIQAYLSDENLPTI